MKRAYILCAAAVLGWCATFVLFYSSRTELQVAPQTDCSPLEKQASDLKIEVAHLQKRLVDRVPEPPDKMLVIAHYHEDMSWAGLYLGHLPHRVYTKGHPGASFDVTYANKGQEALCYLKYILDSYDALPLSIAFVHAHRTGWHNAEDIVPILKRLKWSEHDFVSLNYKNYHRVDGSTHDPKDYREIASVWNELFVGQLGPIPSFFELYCCAQFMVKRERVLARPKQFYQKLHDWLVATPLDNYWTSRIFEHTWPMIFGEGNQQRRCDRCCVTYC